MPPRTRLNFSLTQLEYVVALNKYGHFALAAEACQVTQPTLSMQIQKLENDLGAVLFDRSKKPLLLTEAGQKLISQFQAILFESKKIESIIEDDAQEKIHGVLTLGIIPTIAPYLLPRLLPMLAENFSEIELNILELQTQQVIAALDSDEIDAGILATPLKKTKIFEQPLFYEPFMVLCQKGHALARHKKIKLSNLQAEDVWLLKEGHCLRNQVLDVCSIKPQSKTRRKFRFESGSLETLKNLVGSFGGYTLLPALAAENLSANVKLVAFERPIPAREVGIVYRREHYKLRLIQSLAQAIMMSISEEVKKIKPRDLEVMPISQDDR